MSSLTINLISKDGVGTLVVANPTNFQKTNWEIIFTPKNFTITEMNNLNFEYNIDNSITITPKVWKINIESNSEVISNFYFTGSDNFEYTIQSIKSSDIIDKNIRMTIDNNTDNAIVIEPGKSFTFIFR